jgi:hypothetical protein
MAQTGAGELPGDHAGSVLVENGGQARKVRLLTWLFAVWAVAWLIWAADLSQTYGLSPGDGGALRPTLQRWTMALSTALLGVAPFAGMVAYVRLYVTRLVRARGKVDVTVLGLFAPTTRRFDLTDIGPARSHHGRLQTDISVNAPWITLWIKWRPYIIDLQAGRIDRRGVSQLAVDAARARAATHRRKARLPNAAG